jgi:2-oxoacid:acceptor oxidoreductase delta subunit (pyruvate/2-ketoisovalerate family)
MPEEKKVIWRGVKDMPPMAVSLGSMRVNLTGNWRNVRPVINYEKCTRCMICWKYCPEPSILIKMPEEIGLKPEGKYAGKEIPVIDLNYCKGCGICAVECPVECIELVKEEK